MQHFFAPEILKFSDCFYFTAPGLRVKFIDLVLLEYVFIPFLDAMKGERNLSPKIAPSSGRV
jgi:hypothetical protein